MLTQGDVPIDGFCVIDGRRYKRIGMTSMIRVDSSGNTIGRALSVIPEDPVDYIEPRGLSMDDKQFLQWIYDRLIYVHDENELYAYMHRLKAIIDAS